MSTILDRIESGQYGDFRPEAGNVYLWEVDGQCLGGRNLRALQEGYDIIYVYAGKANQVIVRLKKKEAGVWEEAT